MKINFWWTPSLWWPFALAIAAAYYMFGIDHLFGGWGVMILLLMVSTIWYYYASATLLKRWAARNGFQITSQKRGNFTKGPFFLRSGIGTAAFRVTVYDPIGYSRNGWIRVGSRWSGLSSDKVEVRWDDESSYGDHAKPSTNDRD